MAVLAIAGKANKGKSLFLSFVLRYLRSLQNGQNNVDWMGWNDSEELPLLDSFRWENSYEVVTKGIWTWSEPISIKHSKGQVFDVLLLDTQGVFDEETGQREWNILARLGSTYCLCHDLEYKQRCSRRYARVASKFIVLWAASRISIVDDGYEASSTSRGKGCESFCVFSSGSWRCKKKLCTMGAICRTKFVLVYEIMCTAYSINKLYAYANHAHTLHML